MFSWAALRRQGRQAETYGVDQPRRGRPKTALPAQATSRKAAWDRPANLWAAERMRSARKYKSHRRQPVKPTGERTGERHVCECFDCQTHRAVHRRGVY